MINFRFEIVKQIGKGRSEVYLCKDLDFNGSEVAVKFLSPKAEREEIVAFRNEYFTIRKLDHPNIMEAFEIGEVVTTDDHNPISLGSKYIVQEYFNSTGLLDRSFVNNEDLFKEVLKQICSVLFYLHQSNYIYYDLKPENILISSEEGSSQIKLIDMGLVEFIPFRKERTVKGTAEYIAPELLKKEPHDYRVDLYSLGILLYQFIYGRLPFDNTDEIKIYKAQVEEEFEFPEGNGFNSDLINVCKKLLEKDPDKRYKHTLEVITDLGFEIDSSLYHNFVPARIFCGRGGFNNILSTYIQDKASSEVFSIKGFDGSGKSSIVDHLYEKYPGSILINNTKGITGIELIKYIIKRMIFSPSVLTNLNETEKEKLIHFTSKEEKYFLEDLNSIVSTLTEKTQFLLLIDDFNLFDPFVQEVILELIPIFQINGSKVIISEASDFDYVSDKVNNVRELMMGPFTENQLSEYLDLAYYSKFPFKDVKNLILEFADLLPGNIIGFLKDLITLKVLIYSKAGVGLSENRDKLTQIEGSLSAVYNLRLEKLTSQELNTVKAISCFEINLDADTLSKLLKIDKLGLSNIFVNLQFNNIILPFSVNPVLVIASEGLKKHIYSLIEEKELFHRLLAESIAENLPEFNRSEFARQYELANDFEKALSIWNKEINSAFSLSAFSYARKLLNHLLELPIKESLKNDIRYKLVKTLYKLSDHNAALDAISGINIELMDQSKTLELYIMKGSSLVGMGNLEEGKELIESLIPKVNDEKRKSTLFVEIAYAIFDLNDFNGAVNLCNEILVRPEISDEDYGRIYNLLGMCSYYKDNDFESALSKFQKALDYYSKVGLKSKIAAIEVNIGVMYNIIGDKKNAEASWKRALEINRSVGNISQEGYLLLNNGAYYLDELEFDKSIEYYKRAHNIFLSLGSKINEGIVLSNLGEVYLITCEYQNSFDVLEEAKVIFQELENVEELIPVLVLLCQFYFTLGDYKEIESLYNNTLSLIEKFKLEDKYENDLMLMRNILLIAEGKEIEITDLETIRSNYLEKEDFKNYVMVNTILLNYLIKLELFAKAEEELNEKTFVKVSKKNNIFEANREYLLGVFSSKYVTDDTLSAFEHFERAYELLSRESIVELTWKVLYSLAMEYSRRGNMNKAKNFIIYSRDLIFLIAENIESTSFKTSYLQKEERRYSIEQLEKLQEA